MPTFKPQKPNFYTRSSANSGASGLSSTNLEFYATGLSNPGGLAAGTSLNAVGVGAIGTTPDSLTPTGQSGILGTTGAAGAAGTGAGAAAGGAGTGVGTGAVAGGAAGTSGRTGPSSSAISFGPTMGYRSGVTQLDPGAATQTKFTAKSPVTNPSTGGPASEIANAVKRATTKPDAASNYQNSNPGSTRTALTHPGSTYKGPVGGSATDPASANFIPKGGVFDPGLSTFVPSTSQSNISSPDDGVDDRVIIVDQTGLFVNASTVFDQLKPNSGVLFPYPPTISVGHKANYDMENLLHSNYTTPYYTHSSVDSINIQGRFTAQTEDDAKYILSMIHFFRTVTKMFYAGKDNRGTPPPVLYLDAYGQYMFDHIPIVVKDFNYTLPNDVNYMTVTFMDKVCKVPVDLNITLDTMPVYSRNKISNNFDLQSFAKGSLLTAGTTSSGPKTGGWI
jgi:hypothetical protein